MQHDKDGRSQQARALDTIVLDQSMTVRLAGPSCVGLPVETAFPSWQRQARALRTSLQGVTGVTVGGGAVLATVASPAALKSAVSCCTSGLQDVHPMESVVQLQTRNKNYSKITAHLLCRNERMKICYRFLQCTLALTNIGL